MTITIDINRNIFYNQSLRYGNLINFADLAEVVITVDKFVSFLSYSMIAKRT